MPEILFREALKRGLEEALENDPRVFMMGEDIGEYGGAYAVTDGFLEKFLVGERKGYCVHFATAFVTDSMKASAG